MWQLVLDFTGDSPYCGSELHVQVVHKLASEFWFTCCTRILSRYVCTVWHVYCGNCSSQIITMASFGVFSSKFVWLLYCILIPCLSVHFAAVQCLIHTYTQWDDCTCVYVFITIVLAYYRCWIINSLTAVLANCDKEIVEKIVIVLSH